jgi:Flp pilus assembly protein TadG
MRRITEATDEERGGIAVFVALTMVVILGFAAVSIDVAHLYSERSQLQNGADAAALGVAGYCAKNDCSTPAVRANAASLAAGLANGNANDGNTNVSTFSLDTSNHNVRIVAGAKETGGVTNSVSLLFARALGFSSTQVLATASAQWGTPTAGTIIFPLAIAECKFSADPTYVQVLTMDVNGCGGIPGGFGWVHDKDSTDTKCSVKLTAGASNDPGLWFSSDTGASPPSVCNTANVTALRDQTVLLPLYATASGTGSGGMFYVKGFAAFHVTAYHFSNEGWSLGSSIPNKSIRGYFVKYVSLSQALELGNSPNYGTAIIRLTNGAT